VRSLIITRLTGDFAVSNKAKKSISPHAAKVMGIIAALAFVASPALVSAQDDDRDNGHHGGIGLGTGIGIGIGIGILQQMNKPPPGSAYIDDDKPKPKPKDVKKKDAAAPPKEEKPTPVQPTTCIIGLQYDGNDKDDPANTTHGTNGDIEASAKALGGLYTPVSSKNDLNEAIASFVNAKGGPYCCSALHIVGHGFGNGSGALQLPKGIPDSQLNKDELGGTSLTPFDLSKKPDPKEENPNKKYFDQFIASLKKALCPVVKPPEGKPPADKPRVTFDTCWSADPHAGGDSIAEQVNKQGFATAGYTGKCLFQAYETTNADGTVTKGMDPPAPLPEPYSPSALQNFPTSEPATPSTDKAPGPK
jgi:hypothetical protein